METNGISIPDAGSSTQYISDPVGGWMYTVTTTIDVQQQKLSDYQASLQSQIDSANTQITQLQSMIVSTQAQLASLQASDAQPAAPAQ